MSLFMLLLRMTFSHLGLTLVERGSAIRFCSYGWFELLWASSRRASAVPRGPYTEQHDLYFALALAARYCSRVA